MENKQIKKIRKYYQTKFSKKNTNTKTHQSTYIDRLFVRIFFSAIFLLMVVILMRIKPQTESYINKKLNSQINVLKIISFFTGSFGDPIIINRDITVASSTIYDYIEYDGKLNRIINDSFNGVKSLTDGVVIQIKKNAQKYQVMIQAIDGTILIYSGLSQIDISMYTYISKEQIIGQASFIDNSHTFDLQIIQNEEEVNFYDFTTN